MELRPVGEESLGVRSMCLYVETRDVSILLDAGVSLAPRRFGLPPHPRELERAREVRRDIERLAEGAQVVTVSHYHRDHFTPWYPSRYMATGEGSHVAVYSGKLVLLKAPEDLNWSQRRRHYGLRRALEGLARLEYADGKEFAFGGTLVRALGPFWHGPPGAKTGKVLGFYVADGEERLAFLPDVQGPLDRAPVDAVASLRPTVVVVGGPPTYLGWPLEEALGNLLELVRMGPHMLVLAHHLLRDVGWREAVRPVVDEAERRGVRVETYASLRGVPEALLEGRRRELYAEEPAPAEHELDDGEE